MKIRQLNDDLATLLDDYLREDPVKNSYIIDALYREQDKSDFYLALNDSVIKGVLLIYRGYVEGSSAILRGSREAVTNMLGGVPDNKQADWISCWTSPKVTSLVKAKLEVTDEYTGDILYRDRGGDIPEATHPVIELDGSDSTSVAEIWKEWVVGCGFHEILDRVDRGIAAEENSYFGIKDGDQLVSTAYITRVHPETSILRRVYTKPEYRGKGYGSSVVTRAISEELEVVDSVCLVLRGENKPARALYDKLGFEKYWSFDWLDLVE